MKIVKDRKPHRLQTAVAGGDLGVLGVNGAKLHGLVVGELVETGRVDVEARGSVVDGEHVDGVAVVGQAVTGAALRTMLVCKGTPWVRGGAYLGRVPASDSLVATEVGSLGRNVALVRPAVLGDQTVGTVRAGESGESAVVVVVASVVRH